MLHIEHKLDVDAKIALKAFKIAKYFLKHRIVYSRVGGYLEQKLRRDIP